MARSVFNFYLPTYRPAGELAALQMLAPEMQIINETSIVGSANFMHERVSQVKLLENSIVPKWDDYLPLTGNNAALIERMNVLWMGGAMSAATRNAIDRQLGTTVPSDEGAKVARVQSAMRLMLNSPDYMVQR
jgi:hypothetical protein